MRLDLTTYHHHVFGVYQGGWRLGADLRKGCANPLKRRGKAALLAARDVAIADKKECDKTAK
jgi:hypothetical protein